MRNAILLAALAISTSVQATPPLAPIVNARDYDSFFLWAGVKPPPYLKRAKRLYILQGQVRASDPVRLESQRPALPHVSHADVWMVVRVETLRWSPQVYAQVLTQLSRWRAAGNRLVGLQIDFDARTRHLEDYAAFLRDLRHRLPPGTKLGITGLLDWSANGDPRGLDALAGTVDEVVLQIYQGRHVIPGYGAYLAKLDRMTVPFRIGLLQDREWKAPKGLAANQAFRGYVVFLNRS